MSLLARRLAVPNAAAGGGNGGGGATQGFTPLTFSNSSWVWLHDPKVLYHAGTNTQTYVAWAADSGRIRVGSWDHDTDEWTSVEQIADLGSTDDHTVAALGIRSDGKILACYSQHNGTLKRRISTNAEDITAFGTESDIEIGDITYPNLFHLSSEGTSGRWYLFYREGSVAVEERPHYYRTSDDDGDTWSARTELFDVTTDDRPYVKVFSDEVDQIHFAATHGHPGNTATNAIYHFYYDAGTWRDSGGTDMGTPPFDETDVTTVSSPANEVYPYDISLRLGNPVIVFATFPDQITDHRYHHARWTGTVWDVNEFTPAGGRIAAGTWYSGGLSFDHTDPDVVYLSREISSQWEIEKWTTSDGGSTWSSEAITSSSTEKNIRPVVPQGGGPFDVVFLHGPYTDFIDFETRVVINPPFSVDAYDVEVSADSPLFYYRLAETSGTAVNDETANNNDGTVSGADLNVSGPSGLGSAVSFDGTNDYLESITIGNHAAITVEMWAKIANGVGGGTSTQLWGVVDTTSDNIIQLYVNADGTLTLSHRPDDQTLHAITTPAAWDDGTWHHIVALLNNTDTTIEIWVDGERRIRAEAAGTGTWTLSNTTLTFGARNVRGTIQDFLDADMDEIAVYDQVLSQHRIYFHYTAGTP